MTIIDSHVHVGIEKYEPVEVLLSKMDRNGVDRAVLVQYGGNSDNTYLAECLRRYPRRFVGVAIVDTNRPDATDKLEYWVTEHSMQGIRLGATVESPAPNPYAIWEKAAELKIVVSVAGRLAEGAGEQVQGIARALPDLTLRIEHLGHPDVTEPPPYPRYTDQVLKLAQYPNVYMKLSGLYANARTAYPYPDALPFVRAAYEAFGPKRMMWASDFPPVEEHEGYQKALEFARTEVPFFTDEDKIWLLGGTASQVWSFG